MPHFFGVRFINVHLRRVAFRDVNLRNVIITDAHITGLTVDRFPITALIAAERERHEATGTRRAIACATTGKL